MRIDKKSKKENNYNQEVTVTEKSKKNWPEDLPIKTFRPGEKERAEKK